MELYFHSLGPKTQENTTITEKSKRERQSEREIQFDWLDGGSGVWAMACGPLKPTLAT